MSNLGFPKFPADQLGFTISQQRDSRQRATLPPVWSWGNSVMSVSQRQQDQIEAAMARGGRLELVMDVAWLIMTVLGVAMLVAVSFSM